MKFLTLLLLLNVLLIVPSVFCHRRRHHDDEDEGLRESKRFASFFQKSAGNMVAQDRQKLKQQQQWRFLPERECSSDPCKDNNDCCKSASICHKQAKICTECMFRDTCTTDAQCCSSFSFCDNPTKEINAGQCIKQ